MLLEEGYSAAVWDRAAGLYAGHLMGEQLPPQQHQRQRQQQQQQILGVSGGFDQGWQAQRRTSGTVELPDCVSSTLTECRQAQLPVWLGIQCLA